LFLSPLACLLRFAEGEASVAKTPCRPSEAGQAGERSEKTKQGRPGVARYEAKMQKNKIRRDAVSKKKH
jgi:hypothetical protein